MSDGRTWRQFDIGVQDATQGARVLAEIGGQVPAALARGELEGCFFMQKPPGLRLRLAGERAATAHLAAAIGQTGVAVTPGVYEPETYLFDGPDALRCAHDAFTADTLAVCAYATAAVQGRVTGAPADFSLALCQQLLGALGLDAWERWDVWMRVLTLRDGDWRAVEPAAGEIAPPGGCEGILIEYAARIEALAGRLSGAARHRIFPSGLRRILPFWIAFHWNRMGFDAAAQRGLAAHAGALSHPRGQCEEAAAAWACGH